MKLEEIVNQMSKLYLGRLVDSFLKDVPKDDESKMRDLIIKNEDEFADHTRIVNKLNFIEEDRDTALLNDLILNILLDQNGYYLEHNDLIKSVKKKEEKIIQRSKEEDALKYSDPDALRIYERVLKAAWKWQDSISSHEQNILNVLKEELDLSIYEHRILESKLEYFPQAGNKIHGINSIKNSLKNLQYRGLVARIKDDDYYYVIPEEIARTMRDVLGIELRNDAYSLLLNKLMKDNLKSILRDNNLPLSGVKDSLIERIINSKIKPSIALESLTKDDLTEVLRSLDDVNVTGTKPEMISNIIDFYNKLITYSVESGDEREQFYNYMSELANRNYEQLRGNNIISKDLEIEHLFEDATRFLFDVKLGIEPSGMNGNDNPDGRLIFSDSEVVLWDNKSCENDYIFPDDHFNQFKRYINDEDKRVTLFLVIAPSFTDEAIGKAYRLKAVSETDTDVGLITADEIKYVAENWRDHCSKGSNFNLQVFNYTGRLTKNILKQRMNWALE